MRTIIIGFSMVLVGLAFGVTLTEISLRTFMPELAAKQKTADLGYIKNIGEVAETALNAKGFRESDAPEDLDEKSWFALGGSTAFGVDVTDAERFSERIEALAGFKVYNAAQAGIEGDITAEFAALKNFQSKAKKAVYVVDMGVPLHVLLAEEAPKNQTKQNFWADFALVKVLTGRPAAVAQTPPAWTATTARKYAQRLAEASAQYRQTNEHFIVLVAPARGHYFENNYGAIHRNNQKLMAEAMRSFQGMYAVDLSYLVKLDYATPEILFNEQNRLNATGHRMLASGFLKQYEAFSTWKSFDELSPDEQAKVREDMRKTQEEEARKKAQRPF